MKEEALSPIPDPTLRLPVFASQGVSRTCDADHYNGDADNIKMMLIVVKVSGALVSPTITVAALGGACAILHFGELLWDLIFH